MKGMSRFFSRPRLGRTKIRSQMHGIYAVALLIPLSIMGVFLLHSANDMLNDHCIELLEADNRRVKTLFSEVTTQAYTVSDDIFYDTELKGLLRENYSGNTSFIAAVNRYGKLDDLTYNAPEIEGVYIYTDNPTIYNYKQFRKVTDQIREAEWYTRALENANPFWVSINEESYSNESSNLCLVRRLALTGSEYDAVAVTKISDSYIRSRVDSSSVVDAVSVDDQTIVYSSRRGWYGQPQVVQIDYQQEYYRFSGQVEVENERYFAAVTTIYLYRTNSRLYVCTMDGSGFAAIENIMDSWRLLLLVAILVPGVILALFADYFARRVNLLREEMHKARYQDYNMISDFKGNDELAEAFADLKVMVQDIKQKDAKMYEAELNEKELRNNQQLMEYKMLASQINPHYLYNTLETIRMKALTTGNRELADAVKILGKTLHYVQENTGTSFTTLKKELDHVENYLAIQKLRFGDRINHVVRVEPEMDPGNYAILPLLLQPVVENAVVHGLEEIDGTGMITIDVGRVGGTLRICVRDSGKGMTQSELETLRSTMERKDADPIAGIALYNIHRRIRLCYGEAYGVTLESQRGNGTCVILTLPAESPKMQA